MDDKEIRELFKKTRPTQEELNAMARYTGDFMAKLLGQEYRKHEGVWWLFSVGELRRPLTKSEVEGAISRGDIIDD